jgi:hypothetical protein
MDNISLLCPITVCLENHEFFPKVLVNCAVVYICGVHIPEFVEGFSLQGNTGAGLLATRASGHQHV